MNKTDQELMREFQAGNNDAFAELYQRYKQGLWLYCLKMIGDENAAADVFQDILVRLISKKHLYSGTGSVIGWIFTIARNYCLNVKTRKKSFLSIRGIK